MTITAGKKEKQDVLVTISPGTEPLQVIIGSKVDTLYGKSIRDTVEAVLDEYGVHTGIVAVEDQQALDLVIRARVIAAIQRLRRRDGERGIEGERT